VEKGLIIKTLLVYTVRTTRLLRVGIFDIVNMEDKRANVKTAEEGVYANTEEEEGVNVKTAEEGVYVNMEE
jgi:hypothetical protein